jgi:predicted RNase H-like nuclease
MYTEAGAPMTNARTDVLIGFDSAWTDNPKTPGAICSVALRDGQVVAFKPPRLARFGEALAFIAEHRSQDGCTLVAIDQPTVVPNLTSMRPVERVAASLVSWLGGGVQPSNRGRAGMFCDASPIWPFLQSLAAIEDPETSRTAKSGLYAIEVFPALALASLDPSFFGRLAAPRYNPARRKTYRPADWGRVAQAAAQNLSQLGVDEAAQWCRHAADLPKPTKADQDRLDAMLCLLIAIWWRTRDRSQSMILGNIDTGYMVLPASLDVRGRLIATAEIQGVVAI